MNTLFELALTFLLLVGSFFIFVGAFSLLKLSDFFKRLHGPTKSTTLGVGCILISSVLYYAYLDHDTQLRELLITLFLFITAPISAHMMAKAALSLMMAEKPELPDTKPTISLEKEEKENTEDTVPDVPLPPPIPLKKE